MRKTRIGRFVGVLLAFLAVGSMTLPQVDPTHAAAQVQTTRVKVVLSQAQLDPRTPECKTISFRALRSMMCGFGYLALEVVN